MLSSPGMKHLGFVFVFLAAGCASGTTAYRAHFDSQSEAAGLRACAAQCDAASASGENVHTCLASCPGFAASPSDHCDGGKERPGTYCVTVQDRVYPDVDFWSAVISVAADAARRDDDNDDDDEPSSGSSASTRDGSETTASSPRAHARARPQARSSGRSSSRAERQR